MWISNIGATAMIVTIAIGVLDELSVAEEQKYRNESIEMQSIVNSEKGTGLLIISSLHHFVTTDSIVSEFFLKYYCFMAAYEITVF